MTTKGTLAKNYFLKGCTCAQAVLCAFLPETGLDEKTALALSASFGGGMGRMRLVCGALSGAFIVLGLLYGDYQPGDNSGKAAHYERVRAIGKEFEKRNGSMICAEILEKSKVKPEIGGKPEERTEGYYSARKGCIDSIVSAADILEEYIKSHPLPKKEEEQ
jgi:C_GCAxxG_C_C family probable redox protein